MWLPENITLKNQWEIAVTMENGMEDFKNLKKKHHHMIH